PARISDKGSFRMRRALFGLSALVFFTAAPAPARAEPLPIRVATIPAPGRSVAADDQSSAIALNPANLGYLASSEARWTWVNTSDGSKQPERGHAFDLALLLPEHIGTGIRFDFARPNTVAFPINDDYTWLTWGV